MLFTSPVYRPLSVSGEILPGATLTFYESGTTTKVDVYADAGLQTPLSNPVVADSAGEFVPIYLDPTVDYRALLHDEDDVLLWDVDPLAPARDFPPGTVMWFHGTEEARDAAYPPNLWQVLDGNNGTPDGRDRFPIIAGGDYESGDTGGGTGSTTGAAGGHDHGGATGGHSLTIAELPAHAHGGWYNTGYERGIPPTGADRSGPVIPGVTARDGNQGDTTVNSTLSSNDDPITGEVGEDDPHDHSITAVGDHTHSVDVTPPYVALWALMRRSP